MLYIAHVITFNLNGIVYRYNFHPSDYVKGALKSEIYKDLCSYLSRITNISQEESFLDTYELYDLSQKLESTYKINFSYGLCTDFEVYEENFIRQEEYPFKECSSDLDRELENQS